MKRTRTKEMATYYHYKIKYGLSFILVCFCIKNTEAYCNAENRFGSDCEFTCHCIGNQQCNRTTGDCPSGCDFEWVGPACQRRNIVLNATRILARHSSSENRHDAKLAVDVNLSTCSITKKSNKPWWRLWMSSKYNIRNISILTGSSYLGNFKKFQVMVENNTKGRNNNSFFDPSICYIHGDTALTSTSIHIGCSKTLLGNQIRIQLASNYLQLTLCDVRIYGECDDGTYGVTCTDKCSTHCEDVCDKDNGTCTSCKPRWTGSSCNQECYETTAAGYKGYRNTTVDGIKCQRWDSQSPHKHSQNQNRFSGSSLTEAANYCRDPDGEGSPWCYTTDPNIRWQFCGLDTCNIECSEGTYGINCANNCSLKCRNSVCSTVNGVCNEGCVPGYKGNYCQNFCENGTYGDSCKYTCSGECKSSALCRKTDGVCVDGCSPGYEGAKCDQLCTDGKYGDNCTTGCSPFCKNGTACRKTDGICVDGCSPGYRRDNCDLTCLSGFYGMECKQICSEHCFRNGSNYCSYVNGSCLYGCQAGWHGFNCTQGCSDGTFGRNCAKNCSRNCKDSVCSRFNGTCNNGCIPGFVGEQCNTPCKNGSYGDKCLSRCSGNCKGKAVCRKTDGSCEDGCVPGYGGTKCDERCVDGKYGRNCAFNCSGNCRNDSVCTKGGGTCAEGCKDGYTRKQCNESCINGKYGQKCRFNCSGHCVNGSICRHTDGHCVFGCDPGWIGHTCHDSCMAGTYGTNCTFNCSGHCVNGSICGSTDGHCLSGCEEGWTGHICHDKCEPGLYGTNCSLNCSAHHCLNDTICMHTNGTCSEGCDPGWTGDSCRDECKHGKYGQECVSNCSMRCLNGSVCLHTNGFCGNGCDLGWTGERCEEECQIGTYGWNCSSNCSDHCLNNSVCDSVDGFCSAGCDQGWIGHTCEKKCPNGTYGANCTYNCSRNCLNESVCLYTNGSCLYGCAEGWVGELCDQGMTRAKEQVAADVITKGVPAAFVVIIVVICVVIAIWKRRAFSEKFNSLRSRYHRHENRDENSFHNDMFMNEHGSTDGFENDHADQPMATQNTGPVYANTAFTENHRNGGNEIVFASGLPGGTCNTKQNGFTDQSDVEYSNVMPVRRSPNAISISELEQFMKEKCLIEGYFKSKFGTIGTGLLYPTTVAETPRNMHKNRYKKMYPYDHSRVKLKKLHGQPDSDYINASFIKGPWKENAYIASQGPVKENVDDFWRMIWEINVRTVVVVTHLAENGKMKCIQYWGIKDEVVPYGQIHVTMKAEKVYAEFTIREFSLFHQDDMLTKRDVTQFHFTAWPDKGVPKTSSSLLQFWRKVRNNDDDKANTWLVHCSAGVGRTGTFLALDILFDQGEQTGFIDAYQCVKDLREQRVNLVQTHEQYVLLHKLMLEIFCLPSKPVNVDEFTTKYHQLQEKDSKSGKSKLLLEYQTLENAFAWPIKKDVRDDEFRPILSTYVPGCTNAIKAVYIPSYFDLHEFIITQFHPDFKMETCRLIFEKDISLVVTLPTNQEKDFFENSSSENDPFVVICKSQIQKGEYTIKDHVLHSQNKKHCFKEIIFDCWSPKRLVPDNPEAMLNLVTEIDLKRQPLSDSALGRKSVLLHCSNGIDRSGLVAVLLNMLDRARVDNEVSIPQIICHLRNNRKKIIPNFEQYKFCYEVLNCHLESNATYANV